ncbi:MAG: hypothetical protein WC479_09495 [Candidatus Izemoplasmatales bacterium]|jgi:tRNA uridine 5-carbamoylmethylation protein Kti12|nr:hypothetical protein [Candidatus Izemoplasmatales bacterium]MDD3865914.1 hypothetical protein [Candidatus Izemoplasmatales bacterium]
MPDIIIRQLVEMDKTAREKVDAFQKEKDNFDAFLKLKKQELMEIHTKETQVKIEETITKFHLELSERKAVLMAEYEAILNDINSIYKQNRQDWVDEIYKACLE